MAFNLEFIRLKVSDKKIQIRILSVLIALIILPFLFISYYNWPSGDDFAYGIGQKSISFWDNQIQSYQGWSGRYAATFFISLVMEDMSFTSYKLVPVILVILTVVSMYSLLISITEIKESNSIMFTSLLFALVFLVSMPLINQGLYWLSGNITYGLGNISMVFLLTSLSRLQKSKTATLWWIILGVISLIIGIGSNETTMIMMDVVVVASFAYSFIAKRQIDPLNITFVLIAILLSCTVFFCPGNEVRRAAVQVLQANAKIHDLQFSLVESFFAIWIHLKYWLQRWGGFYLLFIFIFSNYRNKSGLNCRTQFRMGLMALVLIIGLIFLALFPNYWETGSGPIARTQNTIYFAFLVFGTVWIYKYSSSIVEVLKLDKRTLFLVFIVLLLIASPSKNNLSEVIVDLSENKAQSYCFQLRERDKLIKKGKQQLILKELSTKSNTIFVSDITRDSANWRNKSFADYYGIGSILLSD